LKANAMNERRHTPQDVAQPRLQVRVFASGLVQITRPDGHVVDTLDDLPAAAQKLAARTDRMFDLFWLAHAILEEYRATGRPSAETLQDLAAQVGPPPATPPSSWPRVPRI
jgi:hypothetical protein